VGRNNNTPAEDEKKDLADRQLGQEEVKGEENKGEGKFPVHQRLRV